MAKKKQKIRITEDGIYGSKGPIPVGTEITIEGEIPAGWKAKCVVIGKAEPDAKVTTGQEPK